MQEEPAMCVAPTAHDRVVWREDLQKRLGPRGVSTRSVARYIEHGRLPKPDIYLTRQVMGWKASTLAAAGLETLCW